LVVTLILEWGGRPERAEAGSRDGVTQWDLAFQEKEKMVMASWDGSFFKDEQIFFLNEIKLTKKHRMVLWVELCPPSEDTTKS
jgi:hypothetical protein